MFLIHKLSRLFDTFRIPSTVRTTLISLDKHLDKSSSNPLIDATVPKTISISPNKFDHALTESEVIKHMEGLASKNRFCKSFFWYEIL